MRRVIEQTWLARAGAAALALTMVLTGASATLAQEVTPTAGTLNLDMAPVDLHNGTCRNPTLEPKSNLGDLEREPYFEATRDLADDMAEADAVGEDADGDGVLDAGEDLDGDGLLDSDIGPGTDDVDGDGIPNEDEEGFLSEDLDVDGALDQDEDANANGVLDAGIDADGNGVLADDEIVGEGKAMVAVVDLPTVWKVEGEIDEDFDELFGEPQVIAVHESAEAYANIVACADLNAVDWEDSDDIVLGLGPVNGSGFYGYVVLERDTGNFPIFGENTTGVTVFVFQNLPTQRQERMAEATPAP
jgi:hypothetical protein